MKEPYLPQLIDRIEASAKPVVAAVNGTALGGGLELALGCHYRVAAKDVRQLGLPEIKLGIIPGAGGTQRLPRAIGVEQALQLITTGAFIDAAKGAAAGLIDKVADGDVVAAAVAFAKEQIGKPPRRIGEKKIDKAVDSRRPVREGARLASRGIRAGRSRPRPPSMRSRRRRRCRIDEGNARERAGVPRGGGQPLRAGAAVRLLRRAPGRQPAGHRPRRQAARHQDRRHPRRRHHGHRHQRWPSSTAASP